MNNLTFITERTDLVVIYCYLVQDCINSFDELDILVDVHLVVSLCF